MPDPVWDQAEVDLRVQVAGRPADLIVFEHSARVAQMAETITHLPELAERSCDRTALRAAAFYHDAGWVLKVKEGVLDPSEMLLRATPDVYRELAADWTEKRLKGIVPAPSLKLASRAIRELNDRQSRVIESRVLAEADNLDEIGPQAICLMLRKTLAEGKCLHDLLTAWRRQEEYHYWQARISKGLQFETTRQVAETRLAALREYMSTLEIVLQGEDVAARAAIPDQRV